MASPFGSGKSSDEATSGSQVQARVGSLTFPPVCVRCGEPAESTVEISGRSRRSGKALGILFVGTLGVLTVLNFLVFPPQGIGFAFLGEMEVFVEMGIVLLLGYFIFLRSALWLRRYLTRRWGSMGGGLGALPAAFVWLILFLYPFQQMNKWKDSMMLIPLVIGSVLIAAVLIDVLSRIYLDLPSCKVCGKNARQAVRILDYFPRRKRVDLWFRDADRAETFRRANSR